jgi:hypothetical protein
MLRMGQLLVWQQKETTINILPKNHDRTERQNSQPVKQKDKREGLSSDTCVIRTHAPEGIALAGQRVNHSAKVPVELMML